MIRAIRGCPFFVIKDWVSIRTIFEGQNELLSAKKE
jgi:hypothetical protein